MSESRSAPGNIPEQSVPHVRAVERNGSGTERNGSGPSTANGHRDAVQPGPSRGRAREAHTHEAEPETIDRQFVRYVYGDDCQLPYEPASTTIAQAEQRQKANRRGHSTPPIDKVLAGIHSAGCEYRPALNDLDSWQAQCPTHDDTQPSLQVKRNHDGSIWLKCWAGCAKEGILAALGLEWRDLWDGSEHDHNRAKGPRMAPLLSPESRRDLELLLRMDDERRRAA